MPTTIVGATGINKIQDGTVVDADIDTLAASKLTGALPALNGANLTSLTAANIAGALPAISGANLTNLPVQTTDISGKLNLAGGAMTGLLSNTLNVARNANQIRSNATNLLIENTHASGAAGLRFKGGNGEASIIYGENNATDRLYFMPRNDTGKQVVIDHVGKIGIGTAAPLRQLHISNTSANAEIAFTSGTSGTASILFGDGLTGTDVYKGYIQYQHNGDYMDIATGATTRLRVDSDGLKFNADTAAANGLDDYEEGTWTPTLATGTLSGVYGKYVKIGKMCYISFHMANFSNKTSSADVTIRSIPFTQAGTFAIGTVIGYQNGNSNPMGLITGATTSEFKLFALYNASSWQVQKHNTLGGDPNYYITGVYQTT